MITVIHPISMKIPYHDTPPGPNKNPPYGGRRPRTLSWFMPTIDYIMMSMYIYIYTHLATYSRYKLCI